MSSPSKRREMDLMKLMMSDYKVEMVNDGMQEFFVEFRGPNESMEYCEKYAKPEDAGVIPEDKSSDEELSDEDDDNSGDEEIMGKPDP
ncbi:hypothetical protein PR202_ga27058 [Eleusine coracana subsp. coracana]|uniref:Uncharacterized protein n=1 Tax=Eleusine coracana subsp. coracana TaxID=191504 RepID=A0AAV5DGN2_ELECO|nr:hypothetical protein PR202_ga27058 [Eleusine coracana subsp. coracana]